MNSGFYHGLAGNFYAKCICRVLYQIIIQVYHFIYIIIRWNRINAAEEFDAKLEPIPSDKTGKTPKGKLGDMLALLKREEGATVTDLMEATGWQKHSVRGAMSGQLKTKYGLIIQKIATKGEETVYQITD